MIMATVKGQKFIQILAMNILGAIPYTISKYMYFSLKKNPAREYICSRYTTSEALLPSSGISLYRGATCTIHTKKIKTWKN